MKNVKILLPMLVLLLLPFGTAAQAEDMRQISVTGEGRSDAEPDMATISIGVTHTAKVAQAAMRLVSDDVARILDRLGNEGIAARDLQTQRLSLNPVWSNRSSSTTGERMITGFSASNTVMVRVRDLPKLGGILDVVLSEGANGFNGLRFGVQNPDPLVEVARVAAVEDAAAKARLLAGAAGVTLGRVISISEHGGNPQPMMMEMASARGGDVPIASGEVTVQASVSMVFEILD